MAYAKNALYDALLAGAVPDDPELEAELLAYFPAPMRVPAIAAHRLRREIIATILANELVNRMGICFVAELMEATGANVARITASFLIVREVFALPALWAEIEALNHVTPATTVLQLLRAVSLAAEQAVRWFASSGLTLELGPRRREFAAGIAALAASVPHAAAPWDQVPEGLALRIAALSTLVTAMDAVQIAEASGIGVVEAGEVYFGVGEALGLHRLRAQAAHLPGNTPWGRIARDTLVQDSYALQRRLAQNVVTARQTLPEWLLQKGTCVGRLQDVLMEMDRADVPDLALLDVVARRVAALD
jgi:glutamate dehydrogenase